MTSCRENVTYWYFCNKKEEKTIGKSIHNIIKRTCEGKNL